MQRSKLFDGTYKEFKKKKKEQTNWYKLFHRISSKLIVFVTLTNLLGSLFEIIMQFVPNITI